jgi:N-acyl homoserine lactone hydrolase
MSLEIIPLNCGRITNVERSGQQYFTGFGEKICAQSVLWLILGADAPIVVDVGSGTPDLVRERHGRVLEQTPEQHPHNAIRAVGIEPEEVGAVVQTHLHWDHALGLDLDLFPNADIYVQIEEARYAAAPYPQHAPLYDAQVLKRFLPTFACEYPRVKFLNGDFNLARGVRILLTPGHTPGTQAVIVQTDARRFAIASDNVPLQSSWSGPTMQQWIASGIHVSIKDCFDSLARLASEADVVLPSHDDSVFAHAVYPHAHDHDHEPEHAHIP